MKRISVIWICVLLFLSVFTLMEFSDSGGENTGGGDENLYIPHSTISIFGDSEFASQATSEGWPGDGTAGSPYVIENYEIDASFSDGIYIGSTTVHFIIRNSLIINGGNTYHGISLSDVGNGAINNCTLTNNDRGIWLAHWTNNIIISDNTISDNNDGIIIFDTVQNNLIIHNLITYSSNYGIGFLFYWNSGNIIYNNDFINNAIHISNTDVDYNIWNSTYPIGGNYWDDYTGVDVKSGPLQDQPGSDGIGDTPYVTIIQDYYPLMKPTVYIFVYYNIILSDGWNLISLPLTQSPESLDAVLSSIDGKWDYIQVYNPTAPSHWKTNCTYKPDQLNDLEFLDHTIGFWINITEPNVNLTVSGYIPISTVIPLYAGWNLVGYPSFTQKTISEALAVTGYDKPVEKFNITSPYGISPLSDTYLMKPGEAYWIHVPIDTVWVVD